MPKMLRSWPALVVTGLLVFSHAGAARAQIINPFGVNNGNQLSKDDYKVAGAAVTKLLNETAEAGRYEDWSNPATGNGGRFTILSMFTKNDLPCRKVSSHTVYSKKAAPPYTYVLDACKTSAGWKIAS